MSKTDEQTEENGYYVHKGDPSYQVQYRTSFGKTWAQPHVPPGTLVRRAQIGLGPLATTSTANTVAVSRTVPAIVRSASEYRQMLVRQSREPRADIVELLDFSQDRCKRHGQTILAKKPKVGELQMDWLRSEDLKEEKVITTPHMIVAAWGSSRDLDRPGNGEAERRCACGTKSPCRAKVSS